MSIPPISARPTRDDPDTFNVEANLAWTELPVTIDGINAALGTIDSAVTTVTAGLAASLWVSGTTYAVGDLVRSPVTGFLYRRRTAGAGTTDPSADGTNWALQTVMGMPLVIVTATTHTIAVNTFVAVMTAGAACTLTPPAGMTQLDQFGVKVANGRLDNVLATGGYALEGQADSLYLDGPWSDGLWRYLDITYGIGRT